MGRPTKPQTKAPKASNSSRVKRQGNGQKKAGKQSTKLIPPVDMITYTKPPPAWPAALPYLATVHPDSSLTPAQLELFRQPTPPTPETLTVRNRCTFSPTSNPLVTISPITSASHPAYRQSGLFAARPLAPGTYVLDYTGLLHSCPQPTCAKSDYDLAFLDRDASLAIDGADMGNEARFINDYHGIRDAPNAVFEEYFVRVRGGKERELWQGRMGVWVCPGVGGTGILKGEEICLSYGRGYWKARAGLMDVAGEEGWVYMVMARVGRIS